MLGMGNEEKGSHEYERPGNWQRRFLISQIVYEVAEDAGRDQSREELKCPKGVKGESRVWGGFGGDLRPLQVGEHR